MKAQITLFAILIALISMGKTTVANVEMTDSENAWNPSAISFVLEEEVEVLNVEDWMQNDDFWSEKQISTTCSDENEEVEKQEAFSLMTEEESVEVESWMLDETFWN